MAKLDFSNKKNPFNTLNNENKQQEIEIKENSVVKIPTELIDLGDNIRNVFTDYEEELYELGESIKAVGQLQPCIVYKKNDRYVLKYGSRRFKACLKAEIPTVDCIISNEFQNEKERIFTQAIENEHRKNMTDVERESYINELRKMGMSIEEIAKGLKKSKGWISKSLKAFEIREKNSDILGVLADEVDTATMYQFNKLSNEKLTEIIEDVKAENNTSENLGIKIRNEISKQKQEKKEKENLENNTLNDSFDFNIEEDNSTIEIDNTEYDNKKILYIRYSIIEDNETMKLNDISLNNTELDSILKETIKKYYQEKGFNID